MAKFDTNKLSKEAFGLLRNAAEPRLKAAVADLKDGKKALEKVEADVAATLAALQAETDPAKAAMLAHDLEKTLPARKAAIRTMVRSEVSAEAAALIDEALEIAIKVAVIAAKAFI